MPIVHDPNTGKFQAGSGGAGGKSASALQASVKSLRAKLFVAKPGSTAHKRLTNELKRTEASSASAASSSAKLKSIRAKLFTAKPGSSNHKKLSAEAAKLEG